MKESDTSTPIPCIRASDLVCRNICTLFPNASDAFWESVSYDQNAPEEQRRIIVEDTLSDIPNQLRDSVEEILISTGMIHLCKSYLEGC